MPDTWCCISWASKSLFLSPECFSKTGWGHVLSTHVTHGTRFMFAVVCVGFPPPALGVRPVTRQSYGNWADDYAGKVGKAFTAFESGRGSCCQYLDMFSWPFTRGWKEIQYPKLGAFGSLYEGRYPKQSNSKCVLTA